ncbi:MAG: DUF1351 domain-containing protein [Clostridiales bacterium]|nr:DUF1351 domain-containing protein [Clostridiales bacterium]
MELKIYNPQEDGFLQSIDWNFEDLRAEIAQKSNEYMNLVYNDDQIKEAKKDRASLNKLISALEAKRKEIKKQVMIPYEDFKKKEKELVGIIRQAVDNIDSQIKGYEEGLRQEKLKKVKEIYKEAIGDLDRTVPLERIFKDSWLNASTTLKSIKEEIAAIYAKVDADLKVINKESSTYSYEMKEEYLKTFDLSAAMAKKQELEETARKKALFEEQKQKEAEERERRLREEAAMVERAGKPAAEIMPAPMEEPEAAAPEPVSPAAAAPVVRRKRVVIAITANENQFGYLNQVLSTLSKNAEKVEIISKEEI